MNLQGLFLVTGSTRGIGLAIAKDIIKSGGQVIFHGRNEGAAKAVCRNLQGIDYFAVDLSSKSGSEELFEWAHKKDYRFNGLVLNAGFSSYPAPGNEELIDYRDSWENNYWATVSALISLRPLLNKNSSIVAISSICGMEALGCPIPYSDSKAAILNFVKNMANPLGKRGIRVNAVSPGNILFEGSVWSKKLQQDREATTDYIKTNVPLGEFGRLEDIVSMVQFLLCTDSKFVTGANFVIDGGQTRS